MHPYVTPERFRAMGFGVKLDAYDSDNAALRSLLSRASAKVDAALKAPMYPQRHDFRGGAITSERHRYRLPRGDTQAPPRRVHVTHTPVKAVTRFQILVTNTQYVNFAPSALFVMPQTGIIEITDLAMTANGLFGAFIVPVIGLSQPVVEVDYTYGYDFEMVQEDLEATDARTYRAQNQWWTTDPVTVLVNGTVVTTGFTVDRVEGAIVFDVNQPADTSVQVSYHHTLPYEIAQATGIVAADMVGQEDLAAIGLTGLRRLRIAEIEVERDTPRAGGSATPALPPAAMQLLEGLDFITVR